MKLLKLTIFSLLTFFNPISSSLIPPNFALQILENGINILGNNFNDPQNSFNIITDPTERNQFLQQTLTSLDELSENLSVLSSYLSQSIDISFFNQLNLQIDNLLNGVVDRIEDYILTDEQNYYLFDGSLRNILSQRFNESILYNELNKISERQNLTLYLSKLSKLNGTTFDVTTIISKINSYPIFDENSIPVSNNFLIKISDRVGSIIPLIQEFIFSLPIEVKENFRTFCARYNEILGSWSEIESVISGNEINCTLSQTQLSSLSNQDFYVISLFSQEKDQNDDNTKIILVTLIPGLFLIITGIIGWQWWKKRREYHEINLSSSTL